MVNELGAIVYLLMHLYVIAQLLLLPVVYIAVAVLIAKTLFHKSRNIVKVAFILTVALAPIAWLANGYYAFRIACNEGNFEDFSTDPIKNVDGFFIRSHGGRYDSYAPIELLIQGKYKYLESDYDYHSNQGFTLTRKEGRATRSFFIQNRQSYFDFEVTPPEPVSPLKPGFKITRVRVVSAANGDVKAQSTEFVYGGGLIGRYIVYLLNGWNQSKDTYSCGYVDRNIHLFRSTTDYVARDREFIQRILVPNDTEK